MLTYLNDGEGARLASNRTACTFILPSPLFLLALQVLTYLNDVEEGGETTFPNIPAVSSGARRAVIAAPASSLLLCLMCKPDSSPPGVFAARWRQRA